MSNQTFSQAIRAWMLAPILDELKKMEVQMSALSDKIQAVMTGLSAVSDKLTTLGTDLTAEIQALKDKIAAGGVTADDLANLDNLAAQAVTMGSAVQALDDQAKAATE